VQVAVHTSVGTSQFTVLHDLATIVSLSPSSGPVGASVTISGYNFGFSGSVTFNGVSAATTSWNSSTIVATVPSAATTGNVVVTSNSASSPGVPFTVVPAPNISSLSQIQEQALHRSHQRLKFWKFSSHRIWNGCFQRSECLYFKLEQYQHRCPSSFYGISWSWVGKALRLVEFKAIPSRSL